MPWQTQRPSQVCNCAACVLAVYIAAPHQLGAIPVQRSGYLTCVVLMSWSVRAVAIVGRPNVGKSSLLNALVGEVSIVLPSFQLLLALFNASSCINSHWQPLCLSHEHGRLALCPSPEAGILILIPSLPFSAHDAAGALNCEQHGRHHA